MPPNARTFGFVPDIAALIPGDLLLVASVHPTNLSQRICAAQAQGGIAAVDAAWSHAAVYIGDAVVVDAQPWWGVRVNSLYDLVPARKILVRRDPTLTATEGFRVAIRALTRLGRDYSIWQAPRLFVRALAGFWRPNTSVRVNRALVCSTLYSDAYVEVTQRLVYPGRISEVWPGHLSATQRLTDVPVSWIRVQ